jgi:hypothetical protein
VDNKGYIPASDSTDTGYPERIVYLRDTSVDCVRWWKHAADKPQFSETRIWSNVNKQEIMNKNKSKQLYGLCVTLFLALQVNKLTWKQLIWVDRRGGGDGGGGAGKGTSRMERRVNRTMQ